jgi:predicted MFS family arabinose efflux permease
MSAIVAALCTSLLGLGLARFAYTPLIPALIAAHWFSPAQAVYLGAANIGGYLVGAASARALASRAGVRATLRCCLMAATASLFACAWQGGFAWFLVWRLVSGLAGAGLMVLAAPAVLPLIPARHRGLAGGVIFTGIGIGIASSGSLLPLLLQGGLVRTWLILGATGLAVSVAAWVLLPPDQPRPAAAPPHPLSAALRALCAAYGISAAGQVPGMLFLADYVARGLHRGVAYASAVWALFGAGALAGPLLAGLAADRIGHVAALRGLWLTQIAATLACAAALPLGMPAAVLGAGIPGLVVLVLGRSQALAGASDAARGVAWSRATLAFAAGQAVGAYALSFLFARGLSYPALFVVGAVCMGVAFVGGEISKKAVLF